MEMQLLKDLGHSWLGYGKSGIPEWLWKCTKSSDSVRDHSLSESKVLGLSLTCYRCFLDIGTITIESVPHPLHLNTPPYLGRTFEVFFSGV